MRYEARMAFTTTAVAWALAGATAAGAPMVSAPIDVHLPDHLRAPITEAAEAELDPKRGPENARQILERARSEAARRPRDAMTLQLRIAALELRRTFLTESTLDEGQRYEQALATFSRLDLAEPGFAGWLERTLKRRPEVQANLQKGGTLQVAVLSRGAIDRETLERSLRSAFEQSELPFKLAFTPPKAADYLLKVSTENLTRPGQKPAVGLRVVVESTAEDAVGDKQRSSRALEADRPEAAAEAGARWVGHVVGRDLVARFLADRGLPMMVRGPLSGGSVPGLPAGGGHHDHEHDH